MIDDGNWGQDMMASKKGSHYQEQFPDFPTLDIAIPSGFRDSSWHNDACPSWVREGEGVDVYLFIDYPERDKRELPDGKRFMLWEQLTDGLTRTLVESDDFEDVTEYLEKELKEKIAINFLAKLGRWFGADGKKLNAERVLNANDYYDANMAMDYAFKACGLEALDGNDEQPMSQRNADLWNTAWARAGEIQKERDLCVHSA